MSIHQQPYAKYTPQEKSAFQVFHEEYNAETDNYAEATTAVGEQTDFTDTEFEELLSEHETASWSIVLAYQNTPTFYTDLEYDFMNDGSTSETILNAFTDWYKSVDDPFPNEVNPASQISEHTEFALERVIRTLASLQGYVFRESSTFTEPTTVYSFTRETEWPPYAIRWTGYYTSTLPGRMLELYSQYVTDEFSRPHHHGETHQDELLELTLDEKIVAIPQQTPVDGVTDYLILSPVHPDQTETVEHTSEYKSSDSIRVEANYSELTLSCETEESANELGQNLLRLDGRFGDGDHRIKVTDFTRVENRETHCTFTVQVFKPSLTLSDAREILETFEAIPDITITSERKNGPYLWTDKLSNETTEWSYDQVLSLSVGEGAFDRPF